jgi:hypothetical protein
MRYIPVPYKLLIVCLVTFVILAREALAWMRRMKRPADPLVALERTGLERVIRTADCTILEQQPCTGGEQEGSAGNCCCIRYTYRYRQAEQSYLSEPLHIHPVYLRQVLDAKETLSVFYDPAQPTRYYMDTAFLRPYLDEDL